MPKEYHPVSKGSASRRERKRRLEKQRLSSVAPAPQEAAAAAAEPGEAVPIALQAPAQPRAAVKAPLAPTPAPAGRAAKAPVYLTTEARYLGHEFRNIMVLTGTMAVVIVVLSFFLR